MAKLIIGIFLILLAAFMLIGFLNADTATDALAQYIAFAISVILPFFGGIALIYSNHRSKKNLVVSKDNLRDKTLMAEVMKLAGQKRGKLTVVEVISDLVLEHDTAKELLDSLVARGLADVELTESGVIVYSFYEISHLKDKMNAKGVLDA